MKHRLTALGLLALTGCATAHMQMPAALASGEQIEFAGIGGWASGQFTAGEYAGDYHRSAERLSYLEPLVENRGSSRFTLVDETAAAPVEGQCRMRERSVDFGLVEVTTRPMAYRCEFARTGWLELQEFN